MPAAWSAQIARRTEPQVIRISFFTFRLVYSVVTSVDPDPDWYQLQAHVFLLFHDTLATYKPGIAVNERKKCCPFFN